MKKYIAYGKTSRITFEAENIGKAIEWVENHCDLSEEWSVFPKLSRKYKARRWLTV